MKQVLLPERIIISQPCLCDVYGGYRLSIYKDGLVAHYFSVHQTVERADYITPNDLVESELEFDDPDAPLVEEERPEPGCANKRTSTPIPEISDRSKQTGIAESDGNTL